MRADLRSSGGSRPQLITTLEQAARAAERHRAFPHVAGWCRALAALPRTRWPDADERLTAVAGHPGLWVRRVG